MGTLALTVDELASTYRGTPRNDHAKVRFQFFNLAATAADGDAGSTIDLPVLPPGAVRLVPGLSRINFSAFGAGRTLSVGHRSYQDRDQASQPMVDENASAFAAGIDVSAAGAGVAISQVTKYDMYSKYGVQPFLTVAGGTIPEGTTISGYLAYTYE